MITKISSSVVHRVPADVRKALLSATPATRSAWEDITPLARNDWLCWITSVKKPETHSHHIKRACTKLAQENHRPCCWPGCSHR